MGNNADWTGEAFLREIEARSGTSVSACLQCHKCSSGCPVGAEADYLVSQLVRLVRLGARRDALGSRAIWLCASCGTCSARCPMGIDMAGVVDELRILAVEGGGTLSHARARTFNDAFLKSLRRHGRVYELGLMTAYKMRIGDLFSDLDKALKLAREGKLSLLPRRSRGAGAVREVFSRAGKEDGKP